MDKNNKVLIVDDNRDAVELLKKRLRSEGYDTAEAYDGEEGLSKVIEYDPDLVVLDVMMPKLDGYEVCRRLKEDENTRYIPVLMLTAKSDVESKVKGLDIGADDYLPKPFDYKELSARVRSLLAIKAAHQKMAEEERSEALGQMMDEVAHEVRNPLVSIGGFARKVRERLPEGDPNKKYMELIIQDVAVLESMIKQLIELKSLAISTKEPTNINDVILEALDVFDREMKDRSIIVETELSESLPQIPADRKLLKRALCNIINNSIEAMVGETRVLKVSSRVSEDLLRVRISDTGKGIPKDKIRNIFDPFVTSKVYGPGLGLTFTLKIIQDHKGTVSVDSEPGKWTAFTLSFPIRKG